MATVQTLQSGGTVWAMVKKAKPNATEADVEKVLKANNLTWDSAKSLKTGTKIDLAAVMPAEAKPETKPVSEQGSGGTGSNVATNAALSTPADNASREDWAEFLATASPEDLAAKWQELQTYYQQGGGNYSGFNTYLSGKGASATSTSGQLASRTGGYLYNLTGKQFLPGYNLDSLQYKA